MGDAKDPGASSPPSCARCGEPLVPAGTACPACAAPVRARRETVSPSGPSSRKDDAFGSRDPVDPWQTAGGRVCMTALGAPMAERLRDGPEEGKKR